MENIIILSLIVIILIPFAYANASPAEAELILENIKIEPLHPKIGESVTITGEVYNAGKISTNSLASIITTAYFVDGKLLHIDDLGNVEPGIRNKIKISSGPIWKAEAGKHTIKIVIDYRNTLKDQYDFPDDNVLEKTFVVGSYNPTKITLNAYPQYGIQGTEKVINFTAILIDANSNNPLNEKEIIRNIGGEETKVTTNKEGKNSFLNTIYFFNTYTVKVFFEGDTQYTPSNSSLTIHSLPKEITAAMIIKLSNTKEQYNFEEYEFEIIIFQDSYQGVVKKIKPNPTILLDSKTLLVPLSPEHDYFAEIYLDGKIFSVTDKERLKESNLIIKEVEIPETAHIKFKMVNDESLFIKEGIVKSETYSIPIKNGITDWIEVIPIIQEPHVVEMIFPDQEPIKLKPFSVFPGERKTIIINMKELEVQKVPEWVKNNAGWWAAGQIDDDSFIQGIQFMIKEGIIKITATSQDPSLNSDEIPNWVKNNAGWWAAGQIDDDSFIQGIQFMIKEGII